ncbi:MAG: tripartite tricarboxylate transporter substrate binding protein [Betaproteobacteria bacterium]|nr:tripartite tricarboxylate transporter substrate binding protein [Betaproteobacteria bacterium]
MRKLVIFLVAGLISVAGDYAWSQGYPSRPIRLILPYAPGGGSDTTARIIAKHLTHSLRQQVIVDNRPGASGLLGHELGAKATPDGYTLLWCTIGPMAVNVSLYSKLPYDPVRDFEPITLTADSLQALVVHPSIPARNVNEFIALAKAQPEKLNYGSSGNGGALHLAGALFNLMAGVNMVHVPYKGGAPAIVDLAGGHIQVMFATLITSLPHIRAGRFRALAVTTAKRAPMVPELPTIAEAGLPGYAASNWYGVVAPARTPQPIVTQLNREIVKILNMKEVTSTYFDQGQVALPVTPQEFRAYLKSEIQKWGKVIKNIGLKAG